MSLSDYTPEDLDALYRDIFETDRRGVALLEDLANRFAKGPARGFDQAAMHETFARSHQRAVLDYIVTRINRANGVADSPPQETTA